MTKTSCLGDLVLLICCHFGMFWGGLNYRLQHLGPKSSLPFPLMLRGHERFPSLREMDPVQC